MSTNKYDRQLRLWGADGQQRLATTHVLLLRASATGAETLKNLVLPGVQRFTIVDDARVSRADATNNFFVASSRLGESRAQVVTELLLEMNSDVAGAHRDADPLHVLQTEPEYLDQFTLVIGTQLDEHTAALLGELCLAKRLPLLLVTSCGLLGSFRLQTTQHAIADAKNDPPQHELLLAAPFRELQAFADSFVLDTLSSIDHAHVPFVVILLHAAAVWKAQHGGALPSTFADKTAFRVLVQSMARGAAGHEVNFVEAVENAYRAYVAPSVPDEVTQVLTAARAQPLTPQTPEFWLLARSVADFVDASGGVLPVSGVVPDMTASTESYVALQQVYVDKAQTDAAQVRAILQRHLVSLGLPTSTVADDVVDAFCKNAYNIGMLNTKSIADELQHVDFSGVDMEDEHAQQSPLLWYCLLRARAAFASTFARHAGSRDDNMDADAAWLLAHARGIATAGGSQELAERLTLAHAQELTRACEVELHTVAAVMGGVAAQEAVKIVTRQFVPLNHTYIYNGIAGLAGAYDI